jgi:hypothetical protein
MNQRDALVTILDWFADRGEEIDKPVKRALKCLEKRAEVLRIRYERRTASPPEDIFDEPLTVEKEEALCLFRSFQCCRCEGEKPRDCWLCGKCFDAIDVQLRKALQGFRFPGWRHAISRVIRERPNLQ